MLQNIEELGCVLVPGVFTSAECDEFTRQIEAALANCHDDATALRKRTGSLYGARNLLEVWPPVARIWQRPVLTDLLQNVLGPASGLVRVLYFDKPPLATWSLPWHRDWAIAVQDNTLPSKIFTKPTRKGGVPHVEAPMAVLQSMLTLRLHLDAATPDNGPLQVLLGSQRNVNAQHADLAVHTVLANRGDVFAMRPLITHASCTSTPGTTLHRRILHLEFAGNPALPDGYRWHDFYPLNS